jgi:hypothetical protein
LFSMRPVYANWGRGAVPVETKRHHYLRSR